ncbi:hypothetical protein FRC09_014645 [Ceratobasidium sp. 395]|nr:hypothetical protein FRC09_014645 [Ceratobasidium sp. 395]
MDLKITAKVNPDAAPSPIPTRPPSQASNVRAASRLEISSPSPSPTAGIRPRAKITSSATTGSLKVTPAKSPGSAIANGRKTPVSSVASRTTTPRERPASIVGPPTRRPMAPFSQPSSPMLPPSQGSKSPQSRPTLTPRTSVRRVKSPERRAERGLMSPSPPASRGNPSPSPTLARRAESPVIAPGRKRLGSPIRAPALTIPKRGASPTRPSARGPTHRRVASASSALSTSSVGPPELARVKPRLPQSLSAITLDHPSPFSAVPKSPPKSAQADLGPPPPVLPVPEPDTQLHHYDSSTESSKSSIPPAITPPALLSVHDPPPVAVVSSAPVTPSHVQISTPDLPPIRPRTSSVTLAPTTVGTPPPPPSSNTSSLNTIGPGVRIKAKVTPTTSTTNLASMKPAWSPQLTAPDRDRSGSVSGGSTISGIAPSMISGVSSIRVSANSRILSPPPDRRIPFLGLNLSNSTFPVPPALQSPPSTISSMSSTSRHSRRSLSYSFSLGVVEDRARTPTTDLGLRPRMSGGASNLGVSGGHEDEGPERDDSGIDMFEADDGEQDQREEARSNRKIADLEISNKSLLAVNAILESTKARQAKEISALRRKLRESRLVLPHQTFIALERSDPLKDSTGSVEDEEDEEDETSDVTQTQADETFARVKLLLDGLIADAKLALETGPTCVSDKAGIGGPSIRVLNVHDVDETDGIDETDQSQAEEEDEEEEEEDEDEDEEEIESIDGVSPLVETPPVPIPAVGGGGAFSGLRSSLGRWM